MENGLFFKCCTSAGHLARDCNATVKCMECVSDRHHAAMHPGPLPQVFKRFTPPPDKEGGKEEEQGGDSTAITSQCTQVCGPGQTARSCSKITLVRVYPHGQNERAANMYVILDDQSNRSLVRSDFFELFNIKGQPFPYTLKTGSRLVKRSGRKAEGFQVESLDGQTSLLLLPLIECDEILNDCSEIPTPDAARHYPHLQDLAPYIRELDPKAEILILLSRDIVRVHKVRQHVSGPHLCTKNGFRMGPGGGRVLRERAQTSCWHSENKCAGEWPTLYSQPCKGFMKLTEDVSHGGEQKN